MLAIVNYSPIMKKPGFRLWLVRYRVAELRIKQPCDCISHKDNKVVVKCVTIEGSELAGSRNFLRW